jgi:hypothetical protein
VRVASSAVGRSIGEDGVVGVRPTDVRRPRLNAGRVVGDAEDHRLEPVRAGAADRLHVRHALRGLDQDVDPDPSRLPTVALLDLVEQGRDELDVAGDADLGHEHRVEHVTAGLDDLADVPVTPMGVETIDPNADRGA